MFTCTVDKTQMVTVLSKVQGLTGRRSNLAITENILIRSTPEGIRMTATDLETGFEGFYPAAVETQGSIAINARKFYEIIKEFPLDAIRIREVENRGVQIGEGNILYHIMGMNPEDFPETPEITEVDFFSIDAPVFEKMIQRAVIVSATDEKRPHVSGVFVERIPSDTHVNFRFVSTDINRLNIMDHIFEGPDAIPVGENVLVPKKGLSEAVKFLNTDGSVQVGIKNNNFIVKKDSEILIIQLLEGDFPEYGHVLEKRQGNWQIEMDKFQFSKLLKRMSIITTEKYNGAVFTIEANKLMVSTVNPEYGESKEEMDIEFSGDPIKAAFNPKFLMDALSMIDDEKVIFDVIDGNHACLLKGAEDHTFTSFIMPMRF